MSNDYQLINSIPIIIFLIKGMVINDGFMNLDILLQKSFRYQHHYKNYEKSIALDLIPKGLKIKKRHAFEPISKDFNNKWNNMLWDAERNLVELLLSESLKVVERVELDLDLELKRVYPKNMRINVFNLIRNIKNLAKLVVKEVIFLSSFLPIYIISLTVLFSCLEYIFIAFTGTYNLNHEFSFNKFKNCIKNTRNRELQKAFNDKKNTPYYTTTKEIKKFISTSKI